MPAHALGGPVEDASTSTASRSDELTGPPALDEAERAKRYPDCARRAPGSRERDLLPRELASLVPTPNSSNPLIKIRMLNTTKKELVKDFQGATDLIKVLCLKKSL